MLENISEEIHMIALELCKGGDDFLLNQFPKHLVLLLVSVCGVFNIVKVRLAVERQRERKL